MMETRFYYLNEANEPVGPLPFFTLEKLLDDGEISSNTQVCKEGENEWQLWSSIRSNSTRLATVPYPEKVPLRRTSFPGSLLVCLLSSAICSVAFIKFPWLSAILFVAILIAALGQWRSFSKQSRYTTMWGLVVVGTGLLALGLLFTHVKGYSLPSFNAPTDFSNFSDSDLLALQRRAAKEDPESQYRLSRAYRGQAPNVIEDPRLAVFWCGRAAENELADAQFELGLAYLIGYGLEEVNKTQAEIWVYRAAEQDVIQAQKLLGKWYQGTEGFHRDLDESFEWTKRAAESGDPEAQYLLALHYLEGSGTEKNGDEYFAWLKRAADQEFAPAVTERERIRDKLK